MVDEKSSEGDTEQLQGEIEAVPVRWENVALSDAKLFETGLHDLSLPAGEITSAMSLLSEVSKDAAAADAEITQVTTKYANVAFFKTPEELERLYIKRRSTIARLGDYFRGRTFKVEGTERSGCQIPIFVMSAPDVARCSTTFAKTEEVTRNLQCSVKVYGAGLSGGVQSSCRAKCTFVVNSGDTKTVFGPAELTIGEVSVFLDGKKIGQGPRISAIEFPTPEPGVRLAPRGRWPSSRTLLDHVLPAG